MLKSTSSRHRISPCRPQTNDAGVTHECNCAVAGSKESASLISLPTGHDARSSAQDVRPAWRTGRVRRSRPARRGCCSARVLAQLVLTSAVTRIQACASQPSNRLVVSNAAPSRTSNVRHCDERRSLAAPLLAPLHSYSCPASFVCGRRCEIRCWLDVDLREA